MTFPSFSNTLTLRGSQNHNVRTYSIKAGSLDQLGCAPAVYRIERAYKLANQGKFIGIAAVSSDFSKPIFKMPFKKKNVYRNTPSDRHPYTLNATGNERTVPPLYFNQNVFFCISVIVVH